MKMSYKQPAPDGATFASDAFDSQVGREIPVNVEGSEATTGRLIAARVADDGKSVELQLDVDVELPTYGGGSFGFR
jgi:hypothetical protein